jgi:hypothetical protein
MIIMHYLLSSKIETEPRLGTLLKNEVNKDMAVTWVIECEQWWPDGISITMASNKETRQTSGPYILCYFPTAYWIFARRIAAHISMSTSGILGLGWSTAIN